MKAEPYWIWIPVVILLIALDPRGLRVVGSLDLGSPSEGKPAHRVSVEDRTEEM